jgi:excisionase family DNA binding protein
LEYRHWEVAKSLLNRRCDAIKPQRWEVTPLHIAAASGAPEDLLARLLKLGARIDASDECSRSPLCRAAEAGHADIVDWLLDHGADVTRGHENGSTPVYCALRGEHVELAFHLIDRGGKSTLHQAVQCNHLARARQKLNAGADVNHEEDAHRLESPLEMAIWLDSTDMAALLLEFGADPNQQNRSFQGEHGMIGGETSLHKAVQKGSAKMVKLLLAHGAEPDITNADGATPIELAQRLDRMHLANLMDAHLDKKLSLGPTQSGIEPLYTVQKVAELLSVDDSFILELIKTRKITGLKLNEQTLRVPAGSVQRYIAKLAK